MRNYYYMLCSVLLIMLSISCKKSKDDEKAAYTCVTCTARPEATAANDASSKGIYKGVIIGSSGTIKFDIANGNTTIVAVMVIDGVSVTLSSGVTWAAGQAFTSAFTGILNGAPVSVTFSVSTTGQSPTVTAYNIPEHPNASFDLIKETSSNLIECFEGTYATTKPEKGTFNLVLSRTMKAYSGSSRVNGNNVSNPFSGKLNGNNQMLNDENKVVGTITGDELQGTSSNSGGTSVTINAKRTL